MKVLAPRELRPALDERLVQKPHERRDLAERGDDRRIEPRVCGEGGWELAAGEVRV